MGILLVAIGCSNGSDVVDPQESRSNSAASQHGELRLQLSARDSLGNWRTSQAEFEVDEQLIGRKAVGHPNQFVRLKAKGILQTSEAESRPSAATFGQSAPTVPGGSVHRLNFRLPTRKVSSQKINGHQSDAFAVLGSVGGKEKLLGFYFVVDGKLAQILEYDSKQGGSQIDGVKLTQLDSSGRVIAQAQIDTRGLRYARVPLGLGTVGLQHSDPLSRMRHAIAHAVLPDALEAQTTDPCNGAFEDLVEAGSLLSAAAAANSIAAATCAVTLITCEAFLGTFAAASAAAIFYNFKAYSYAQCRAVHGDNCGFNPYDWQPCNNGGGTGGGSGGGDGGSGTGGGGGGTTVCWWETMWYMTEDNVFVTESTLHCIG